MALICSVQGCNHKFSEDEIKNGICPTCGEDLDMFPPKEEAIDNANDSDVPGKDNSVHSSLSVQDFVLIWPWGEECLISGPIFVGRVPPAETRLAERLENEFGDVSRMHAEISRIDSKVYIRDLRSANGTFLNGNQIEPFHINELEIGAELRFGSSLKAEIRQSNFEGRA